VLASLGPLLRTDPSVVFLDIALAGAAVVAWSFAVNGVAVTRRSAARVGLLAVQAGLATTVALAWLLGRAASDGVVARGLGQLGRLTPVVRGALVAIPVVAAFSFLLTSADAVFGRALDDVLHLPFDVDDVLGRAAFSLVAAFLVAGPIALAAAAPGVLAFAGFRPADASPDPDGDRDVPDPDPGSEPDAPPAEAASEARAGPRTTGRRWATESLVVLAAVDVLFAAFAVVQVVYLFGGTDTLAAIGMTYSDYARQGYFQLVGVVALAGLLLLGTHELVGRTRPFLAAGLTLLVLTGVILASAALRLRLYQEAYGWTELRFFVAASILWLAACVGLAVALLARDRMRWLPHGIAVAAVAVTLGVSALGPQAFVMHQNLARVLDPRLVPPGGHTGFDVGYGLSLGDDAIPDLVAALDALPATERAIVVDELWRRRAAAIFDTADDGPLSWNLARDRAWAALEALSGR
jgi:hypothetical protein